MNITDKDLEQFEFRFFIFTRMMFDKLKKEFGYTKEPKYRECYMLFDLDKECVMAYSGESMIAKTFEIKDTDLSSFDEYKVTDEKYLLQCDKVRPKISRLENIYALDHIWIGFTYFTKDNKRRMCLNSNLFGRDRTFKSREYKLYSLLLENQE